ncbi:ABC transporter permease [Paenibacillus sp. M1]|uniref:ABC transporter permease n=1 Tax=Paenibacillus haidiansis TaxID=1574488 RepID=A0ABU7VWN9_9BACL
MTFPSIVRKNFLYHAKKYMSLYFVNTLIVAILFLFGSLMFNSEVGRQVGDTTIYGIVRSDLIGVVLFSIVFITYSHISFLKYRGKEFSMYITLGMTTKNLGLMLLVEQAGIAVLSLFSGLVTGAVFGKLFFMGLNRVLMANPIPYEIKWESLLLSSGIFLMILGLNLLFSMLHTRKITIAEGLKSAQTKGIGSSGALSGSVALALFAAALILLPKIMLGKETDGKPVYIMFLLVLTMICPYVILGSWIKVIRPVAKRFKRLYNHNLIVMSNLSHRFVSYRTTVYIVSLLIAGAVFFIGMTYAMYATSQEKNDLNNPFDVMYVETNRFNHLEPNQLETILEEKGVSLEQHKTLEYVEVPEFRYYGGSWVLWDDRSMLIGESGFNRHLGTDYEVAADQALFARVKEENKEFEAPDMVLPVMDPGWIEPNEFPDHESKESLLRTLEGYSVIDYRTENIDEISGPYINNEQTAGDYFGQALVVDDRVYETVKAAVGEDQVKRVHLLKGEIPPEGFQALLDVLREANGLDSSYWTSYKPTMTETDETRLKLEELRPIHKDELLISQLESSGMIFFIFIFMGTLFALASGIVIYHKVLSDIDDQKESMLSLGRIGVTSKELRKLVSKELAIVFLLPALFGVGLGLYYFYFLFSNQPIIVQLLGKSGLAAGMFWVIQTLFYFACRRKYFSELGKYA